MTTKLKFASLVRVSSKEQEREGESLEVQREHNEADVKALGGTIVEEYGGQEHATAGHERPEFNRLLEDAQAGKFDAVIMTRPDRWSRDNERSESGLNVLRNAGIKFYTRQMQHNLFDRNARLFLQMATTFGDYQAA